MWKKNGSNPKFPPELEGSAIEGHFLALMQYTPARCEVWVALNPCTSADILGSCKSCAWGSVLEQNSHIWAGFKTLLKYMGLWYMIQENHCFTAQNVILLSLDSHLNVSVFKCGIHVLLFDTVFKILAFSFFALDILP